MSHNHLESNNHIKAILKRISEDMGVITNVDPSKIAHSQTFHHLA